MFRSNPWVSLVCVLFVLLAITSSNFQVVRAVELDPKTLSVPLRPKEFSRCANEAISETFAITDEAVTCPCKFVLRHHKDSSSDGQLFIMPEKDFKAYERGSDHQHLPYTHYSLPVAAEDDSWETVVDIQEDGKYVVAARLEGTRCMDINYIFASNENTLCPMRLEALVGGDTSVPPIETKVIHGTSEFDPEIQKFMVGVYTPGQGACTGTVVGEQWVLTAAHCEPNVNETRLFIGGDWFQTGYEVRLDNVVCHPKFSAGIDDLGTVVTAVQNDICLLHTKAKMKGPKIYINKNSNVPKERDIVRAAGYGLTFKEEQRGALNTVDVSEIPFKDCKEAYNQVTAGSPMKGLNSRVHVCAGPDEVCGGGVCRGDSGGPLMIKLEDAYTQIGVVSFGLDCAYKSYAPDVFARLSYFSGWIESATNGEVITVDPTREVVGPNSNSTEAVEKEQRASRRRRRNLGFSIGGGVLLLLLLCCCIGSYFFIRRRDSTGRR